jgi:hypothetical protein
MSDVTIKARMTQAQARRVRQALRAVRSEMSPCGRGTVGGHVLMAAKIDGRSEEAFDVGALCLIVAITRALGEPLS